MVEPIKRTRKRLTKKEKETLFKSGPFANICDQESLIEHLQQDPFNPYNKVVLELIQRENSLPSTGNPYDEKHHIIPTRLGGPDEAWNMVRVSYQEHMNLHRILLDLYGDEADLKAANARANLPANAREKKTESSRKGHETMKKEKIGFYNSEKQRELGKRSGGKQTPAREIAYQNQAKKSNKYTEIFKKELLFNFQDGLGEQTLKVGVPSNTFQRTGQIQNFLVEHTPANHPLRDAIQNDKYFTSNFNKVLRRFVRSEQQTRQSYKGWSVEIVS